MKNETVFIEVFGNNPIMKVLDFLITFQLFDYPLTEIARNSEVSYSTLQTFWNKLEKNKNKENCKSRSLFSIHLQTMF